MNKKNIFILLFSIIFFLIALVFLFSTFSSNTPTNTNQSSLNTPEPTSTNNNSVINDSTSEDLPDMDYSSLIDFNFYDKDNNELSLSRYKDKPIAILFSDFLGSYDSSVEALSLLESFYESYKSNVQFFCIDQSTLVDSNSNISVYKDKNGIENYSITSIPTFIFINKEGEIVNTITEATIDMLEANLDLITGNF